MRLPSHVKIRNVRPKSEALFSFSIRTSSIFKNSFILRYETPLGAYFFKFLKIRPCDVDFQFDKVRF